MKFGGDYKRIQPEYDRAGGFYRTFVFTGLATEQPGSYGVNGTGTNGGWVAGTGSSLADLAAGTSAADDDPGAVSEGVPAREHLRRIPSGRLAGEAEFHRAAGLRYEYFSPYSEKDGRLATIDPSEDFCQVAPVLAGGVGPVHGPYPETLIYPDQHRSSPRVGFAWRAIKQHRGPRRLWHELCEWAVHQLYSEPRFQPPFADVQTNQATELPPAPDSHAGEWIRHPAGRGQLLREQKLPAALRAGVEPGYSADAADGYCAERGLERREGYEAGCADCAGT